MNQVNDIVDVFEMTPTQAGMLFQSLYAPDSGVYFQQYWGRLNGVLDAEAFRAAWQSVIERHDILRGQCHWEDLDRPALAIHRNVTPEWSFDDWTGVPDSDQEAHLKDWLVADRQRGFDLSAVPLMRFALIRTGVDCHVFVWSFHHLLLDGWCGALLIGEVLDLYGGAAPKSPSCSFGEFVDWHGRQDHRAALDFWAGQFAGMDGPTALGIDRAETGETGLAEHRKTLGSDLTAEITAFCRRERLTLATLMQGAWALILSRYADQQDVTFGTVLSGRPADLVGAEDMIGLFLQTVPLRIATPQEAALLPWLREIQSGHPKREAFGHIGLADIRAASGFPASAPMFESLVIVETYPESIEKAVSRSGAAIRLHDTGVHERTDSPLVLKLLPGEDLTICLTADATRIPSTMLPNLMGHLETVFRRIVNGANSLGEIGILTPAELLRIDILGQGTEVQAGPTTLSRLLQRASDHPDSLALETPSGTRLTCKGLMARSGEIASALHKRGISKGDIVAICQDRTPDLVASLIAVWRCGATYLPLDPSYPADRVAYILSDAKATLVLADEVGAQAPGLSGTEAVLLLSDCAGMEPVPDQVDGADLAYVLYTSGSTGRPKGVPITHGALSNFLCSMCNQPGIRADDRLLALTTIAFDIAGLELFGPLVAGGTVVLAGTGAGMDGGRLARMIEQHRITIMQATPAGWRVLRDAGWQGAAGLTMISGGEALDSLLARDLLGLGGELWNLYGPTETTIWSAALKVNTAHLLGPKVPVGGPVAATALSLRDGQGRLVPFGVAGELWIGGAGLSPGYLGRPDLTADRFITQDGARHYRTGDRMRLNANGTFEFLGRFDDQVKLRGYRIELGEIEAQMETHPEVAQAVAMVLGEGNAARLVAYIRAQGAAPGPAEMRAHLSQALPGYMIPTAWVTVPVFPLTPNGKIDRKALPPPESGAGSVSIPNGSMRDDVVAGIWAEVLEVQQVKPADDFFALGGQSLLAIRVIGEIRRHLGVDLSLRDLFDAPVFERFCVRISERSGLPSLPGVAVSTQPAVLSAAQHRQWVLSRLAPEASEYHLPLAIRLTGPLAADKLQRALSGLAERHSVLRCRFPSDQGVARAEILPVARVELAKDDLSELTGSGRDAAFERLREREANTPFALETETPWRVRLVKLGAQEHVLLMTFHHILADEWSFGIILDDLRAGYVSDELTPLPAVQYPDFAAWQRGLSLDDQLDHWCRTLDGAPAYLKLPTDRPRPERRDGFARRVSVSLDPETTRALEQLAYQNGATLFICLLAAYAVFLRRHSGDEDILIGTPVSNRRLTEFQGLVGLFVNTLVIRADLTGAHDFTEVVARMRDTVLASHDNQDIPFEQVLEALSPPRSESHAPLVQTMFSMPDPVRKGDLGPDLHWEAMPTRVIRARFDLSLELSRTENGLTGHFDCATDIFDEGTSDRLASRFSHFLKGLAGGATQPLTDLPLMSEEERILTLPPVAHIQANPENWLRDHALARPEARAVGGMSYAELHAHVLGAAAVMSTAGVAQHVLVGVPSRGVAGIIGLLAALQLGATVVPLDSDRDDRNEVIAGHELSIIMGADELMAAPVVSASDEPGYLNGKLVLRGQNGLSVIHDWHLLEHLSTLADCAGGPVSSAAPFSSISGLAALAVALRAGVELVLKGPTDGLQTGRGRILRFGLIGAAETDVQGTPELPAALIMDEHGLRPAGGIRACILGVDGEIMPLGSSGRLAVGGPALARGYLGDPAASVAFFRPNINSDPRNFNAADGCLFVTGLIARQDSEGRLQIADTESDVPRLRAARAEKRTPDRDPGMAPQGAAELILAAIWANVLAVQHPGRNENFFDLGGDSILAVQVAARAVEAGYAIEPRDLFQNQTIASLADAAKPVDADAVYGELPRLEGIDMDAIGAMVSFGDE